MRVSEFLTDLGWTLAAEKCNYQPARIVKFLGWQLDLQTQTISMTRKRRQGLLDRLHSTLQTATLRATMACRELASLLGELNFLREQFPTAALYTNRLNAAKSRAVRRGGWCGRVRLTPQLSGELKWWLRTIAHNTPRRWTMEHPTATITTDASHSGWGAVIETSDREAIYEWGSWPTQGAPTTSNARELMAILLGLKAATHLIDNGSAVLIRSDNTAAVFSVRKWRGCRTRIPTLRKMARLAVRRSWQLTTQYLPGAQNGAADSLSRMGASCEFALTTESLATVETMMGQPFTLDVFATRDTTRLDRYCTLDRTDEEATAIDGLSISWEGEVVLLHPPPALILRTIRKASEERTSGVLIVPSWRGQIWFPALQAMSEARVDLGTYEAAVNKSDMMTRQGWLLPPGNVHAHRLGTRTMMGRSSLTSSPEQADCL
jgi:ribonuclease HI